MRFSCVSDISDVVNGIFNKLDIGLDAGTEKLASKGFIISDGLEQSFFVNSRRFDLHFHLLLMRLQFSAFLPFMIFPHVIPHKLQVDVHIVTVRTAESHPDH